MGEGRDKVGCKPSYTEGSGWCGVCCGWRSDGTSCGDGRMQGSAMGLEGRWEPVMGMEGGRDQIRRAGGMWGPAVGMEGRWEPDMGDGGLRDLLQGLTVLGVSHHPQV